LPVGVEKNSFTEVAAKIYATCYGIFVFSFDVADFIEFGINMYKLVPELSCFNVVL